MEIAELIELLSGVTDEQFVDSRILNRTPWIFRDVELYAAWRAALANEASLDPDCFYMVGSAATGFSLNPFKPGREFRALTTTTSDKSDLDIAIVSEPVFLKAWNVILSHERSRTLAIDRETCESLRKNIYWGHVADHLIPRNTDPARQMRSAVAACGRNVLLRGYKTSVRLYRRLEDLRGYQINSMRHLRLAVKPTGE